MHPDRPRDAKETYADVSRAARDFGFKPSTTLAEGIPRFVSWFPRIPPVCNYTPTGGRPMLT